MQKPPKPPLLQAQHRPWPPAATKNDRIKILCISCRTLDSGGFPPQFSLFSRTGTCDRSLGVPTEYRIANPLAARWTAFARLISASLMLGYEDIFPMPSEGESQNADDQISHIKMLDGGSAIRRTSEASSGFFLPLAKLLGAQNSSSCVISGSSATGMSPEAARRARR